MVACSGGSAGKVGGWWGRPELVQRVRARPRHVAGGARHHGRLPRELRALMDDRPMRIRVRTNRPRELAGALVEAGTVVGVRLDGEDVLELDTRGRRGTGAMQSLRSRVTAVHASTRCRPLDADLEGVFRTWCSGERGWRHGGGTRHARLARRALPAAAAHAFGGSAPARHRRSRCALSILIGVFARLDDNPARRPRSPSPLRARSCLVPLATLWLGCFGDRRPRRRRAARNWR